MPTPNNRNEYDISLVQQRENRQAMVEKMRGKLAAPSQAGLRVVEGKRRAARKSAFNKGWKVVLAGLFLCGNYMVFSGRAPIAAKSRSEVSPLLPEPSAKLDANNQALYWTFALYDYDRLKASYPVPENAIINAGLAAQNLRTLLPKVDARTRFIIDGYRTNDRRKS
ncbi:MAG: hypothetical protein JWP91_51 [Fibrobacteres bacterium]|nr:hypothetical protein [Fibrobacterota bacterium]